MAVLSIQQKCELCEVVKREGMSPTAAIAWATRAFSLAKPISLSTVKRTLRRSDALTCIPLKKRKGKKTAREDFVAFDSQLRVAFDDMASKLETVSGRMVIRLAKHVASQMNIPLCRRPRFSTGWLCRFQQRHGIQLRVKHGEAGSVTDQLICEGRRLMRALTAGYLPCNTYNMDETALWVNQVLGRTLSRRKQVAGRKKPKDRLTMCLTVNADGTDKLPPLFIGTAKNPRALKGRNMERDLGVTYTNSGKGWMTSSVFIEWLLALDERMRGEKRSILLLVDNVSSHVRPDVKLTNVRLAFLPKNTTSVLQPLDQGIISCVKRKFYAHKADYQFDQYLAGKAPDKQQPTKVDVWHGMLWMKRAWDQVSPETIQNCWRHAGILWDRKEVVGLLNPVEH